MVTVTPCDTKEDTAASEADVLGALEPINDISLLPAQVLFDSSISKLSTSEVVNPKGGDEL